MKFYLNSINSVKWEYINNFLLGKKLIDMKIDFNNKMKLKYVLDNLNDQDANELKLFLNKKKNNFSTIPSSIIDDCLDSIFETLYHFPKDIVKRFIKKVKKIDPNITDNGVLYTLYYLRNGCSFDFGCIHFNVSKETFRRSIWNVLKASSNIPNKMNTEYFINRDKYEINVDIDNSNRYFSLIVEGTFAPYRVHDTSYIGHKGKGVIYQFIILAKIGIILDVYGPVPASQHDVHTFSNSKISNLPLKPGEKILGDKGYIGRPEILIPHIDSTKIGIPLTNEQKAFNYFINKERQLVERTFKFLKFFKFFHTPWPSSLKKHQEAVIFVSHFHNLAIDKNNRKYIDSMISEV